MKLLKRILKTTFLMPFALMMGVGAGDVAGTQPDDKSDDIQNSNGDPAPQNNSGNKPQDKVFTQAEVNALMAKEKEQGRKAILKELGVGDIKNAKDALDKYKEYLESQKSDLQKAQDLAAEAEKNRKASEDELLKTKQKLAAITAGCPPEKVDDIVILAQSRMNDKTTFEQAIEQIKQSYPDMFGQTQNKGTGSNANPQNKGTAPNNGSVGSRLASMHVSESKNPYFNS